MGGKLVDIQTAKDFVGISSTTYDVVVDVLLQYLTSSIARYLGLNNFDKETKKDVFFPIAGETKTIFKLSKYPVDLSQTFEVKKVDYDENNATVIDDTYYYVVADKGTLVFSSPDVVITSKIIEVSYTGGYDQDANNVYIGIPDGIRFACLLWFSTIWNTRQLRGIERVNNTARQSIEMATQVIPDDVQQLLFQYQRSTF